ncbi:hypothetical protein CPB84DRAFT_1842519 [Gymnopilus junonius]|uniref:DUF7918 domain-containing protein n=1 Tax=Gymnopilus junonius TaxID=109634 RepID=A0A9P5NY16_GYMJU|nr:hypothetical protein CPB84DRAFT_1842519 [Gymnopilus junonius]
MSECTTLPSSLQYRQRSPRYSSLRSPRAQTSAIRSKSIGYIHRIIPQLYIIFDRVLRMQMNFQSWAERYIKPATRQDASPRLCDVTNRVANPLRNFNWIQVDDNPLPEYNSEFSFNAHGKQTVCWVPSVVGKEFEVYYKDDLREITTAAAVAVDGKDCGSKILFSKQLRPDGKSVTVKRGITISDSSIRPFVFSKCDSVGVDDEILAGQSRIVGQIVVHIYESRVSKRLKERKSVVLPSRQVHEQEKSLVVHCTQLGGEVSRTSRRPLSTTLLRRLVSFVFKYRPLATKDVVDLTLDDEDKSGDVLDRSSPLRKNSPCEAVKRRPKLQENIKPVFMQDVHFNQRMFKEDEIDSQIFKLEEQLAELRAIRLNRAKLMEEGSNQNLSKNLKSTGGHTFPKSSPEPVQKKVKLENVLP